MAIKRPRIDPAKLGIVQESAEERRSRIYNYQDGAQSRLDRIAEREAREDARQRRISERINSGALWLDMRDLMGGEPGFPAQIRDHVKPTAPGRQRLTEEFPTAHDNMIMEDQPRQRRSLQEDVAPRQAPPWGVKKFLGETRGGDTVPVWKIANTKTGSAVDKLFRIESVAMKVAHLLNESGDQNDPRAVSLIASYDKRDRLLKEARQLEKTADGKPMKTERLRAIRAEINQLEYRLGI